jgi:hypothetical protein
MRIKPALCSLVIFSFLLGGCGGKSSSPDFNFIDGYLTTWDRFAQGNNQLFPQLKRDTPKFQRQLADALNQGDKRAPSRLVFYAVVQVGGFIAYDSELGHASERLLGKDVPIFTAKDGERSYFAGDLYFWWERRHRSEFDSFPLYDEWKRRDFAKKTVIPMYQSATKKR